MPINPLNVIKLLLVVFQTLNVLYKEWEPSAVEDTYAEWTRKLDSRTDEAICTKDDKDVDFDYKQRAVEFWRSGTQMIRKS